MLIVARPRAECRRQLTSGLFSRSSTIVADFKNQRWIVDDKATIVDRCYRRRVVDDDRWLRYLTRRSSLIVADRRRSAPIVYCQLTISDVGAPIVDDRRGIDVSWKIVDDRNTIVDFYFTNRLLVDDDRRWQNSTISDDRRWSSTIVDDWSTITYFTKSTIRRRFIDDGHL